MGFDNRIDDNIIDNGDIYQTRDFIGYVQYNNRGREGVNQNIIYKKRLKNGGDIIGDQDYTLLDMDISKYSLAEIYNLEGTKEISLNKLESISQNSFLSLANNLKKLSITKKRRKIYANFEVR